MKFIQRIYIILFCSTFFVACESEKKSENPLQDEITKVKSEFAPDKRVALFDLWAVKNNDAYILKGESNLPQAVTALKENLESQNIAFVDSIQMLPSEALQGKTHGVIKISVANLRSKPGHSSELATQATLGTPVKVYKQDDNWYFIQTPDNYLAWVDRGGVELMDKKRATDWKSFEKIIYTKTFGQSYSASDTSSQVVSDMVAGAILEKIGQQNGFFEVRYPDGRLAFIYEREAQDYNLWLKNLEPTTESLVATSKTLMGLPYLWGGTSPKGVDCSGFTKTIYFLNGMVIPRDASQQVHSGKEVDSVRNFENLEKGDLLFFGRQATDSTKEKVVHVGMWIGNNEFIHSSGRVHISSMDANAENYDEYNRNRYLRSNRYLADNKKGVIELTKTPLFKD
ncbi:C40 family peptidase [uncultured Kriegella sp.]|uniref:C40 family peptidase n=1 Tax=uncultured Kriegella sp. TaxID=1798910 RepID=UPI0030D9BFC5|tara:strand:- start:80126 stop:81319 length:1194 start_codon:yes stop_codon:yes gene_type:complete